jgi:tetratricopeptide (TPR) repeat protein
MRSLVFLILLAGAVSWCAAQEPPAEKGPWSQQPPPTDRDQEVGESSSRDTRIDLSPPKDDAKHHPGSAAAVAEAESDAPNQVQEFHPWNPHKAAKDIEVGDFYFRRKNYRAAADRYQEALVYKPDDALANYRLGQCFEKLDKPVDARTHYEAYLKILPHGPLSEDAKKALEKLGAPDEKHSSRLGQSRQ